MIQIPIGERLQNIDDEIKLLDSTIDARSRELWQAVNTVMAALDELRDQVKGDPTRI